MVSQLIATKNGALDSALVTRLRRLPGYLAASIKGQDHALPRIVSVLTRGELGLANPRRPRGSFLFVGPTGVGKTETAVVFSNYLFGAKPIRFDMSEYQLQKSVDRLLGENALIPASSAALCAASRTARCFSMRSKKRIRWSSICSCKSSKTRA